MGNFSLKYPQVKLNGFPTATDVSHQYTRNIFDTWSAVIFDLTDEQITSNHLIVNQVNQSVIDYKIRVSPSEMYLPDVTVDEEVYRDSLADADQWANSGYFTIQNFISTYSASLYDDVDPAFTVSCSRHTYGIKPYDRTTQRFINNSSVSHHSYRLTLSLLVTPNRSWKKKMIPIRT